MKMIETKQVVVTEVKVGDIFQFVKGSGCREVGELLVVSHVTSGNVIFVPGHPISANCGGLPYLSEQLSAGNLVYAGTVLLNNLWIR